MGKLNQTKPSISVTVPMEESLEKHLRTLAAEFRISRAELIRQIIIEYLPTYEKILSMEK